MAKEEIDVTVGIPTQNRDRYIENVISCLIRQQRLPNDIIIVDDSRKPVPKEKVSKYRRDLNNCGVDFIYEHRTQPIGGLPGARNEIIATSSSDIICFIDDDVTFESDWLENIVKVFRVNQSAVAVGGPAISMTPDLEPVFDILRDDSNRNFVTENGEVIDRSNRWIPSATVSTDTVLGANMAFRRDELISIGGFDERFRGTAAFEEHDVLSRLKQKGGDIIYQPNARVNHFVADTGGTRTDESSTRNEKYWFGRNLVRFRWKNFTEGFWAGLIPLFFYPKNYAPLWKQPLITCYTRDISHLWHIKGYIDGIRFETGDNFECDYREFSI